MEIVIRDPLLESMLNHLQDDFGVGSMEKVINLLVIHHVFSSEIPDEFVWNLIKSTDKLDELTAETNIVPFEPGKTKRREL